MSDDPEAQAGDGQPKKKSKAMLVGLVGALVLGGASFYGVYSGMIPLPFGGPEGMANPAMSGGHGAGAMAEHAGDTVDRVPYREAAFITMEPLVISLGATAKSRYLQVVLSIEVEPGSEAAVSAVTPRINDVLNTYLRAVDEREFEVPRAMMRLRAQMLRRVQLVTPPGAVRDLLIQQFILN